MGSHINFLSKEELLYENIYRGVPINQSNSSVETLRRTLRTHYNFEGSASHFNGKIAFQDELSTMQAIIFSIKTLLNYFDAESPADICRLKAKVTYLNLRLTSLGYVNTLSAKQKETFDKLNSDFSELKTQAKDLKCSKPE